MVGIWFSWFFQILGQALLQTILLGDVVHSVAELANPLPSQIVMKIDIELFECKAFLGSPEVLRTPQLIPIRAVLMEWVFPGENGKYSDQCPREKVVELTKLFLDNGYTPFRATSHQLHLFNFLFYNWDYRLSRLDISKLGTDWNFNVVWLSNNITSHYLWYIITSLTFNLELIYHTFAIYIYIYYKLRKTDYQQYT